MRTRHLLAAATAAALVAGCGGSSSPRVERADGRAPTNAAPGTTPTGATPAATETAPDAAGRPTATEAAARPEQQSPRSTATPAARPAGTSSTAAGTYTYDSSGTVDTGAPQPVDGTATLTVDRPAGGQQHSVLASEQGRTEQDVVVRVDGTYLARLSLTNPAFTKEFRPTPPVLLVPDPASPGRSWSWTATSTDGKTTAALTARVTRTETLTIGGVRTATSLVDSTLRLTGDITYTGRMQTWYDAEHRLTVKDHTKGNGTVNGIAFTTDITSVLRSTRPS